MTWSRIEPSNRTDKLELGLQARLADPLFLVARQWQLGELRGEDAASPIHVHATTESYPIQHFAEGHGPRTPHPVAPGELWESRAEAETIVEGPSAFAMAAQAGRQLVRRLNAQQLQHVVAALRRRFPLELTSRHIAGLEPHQVSTLRLMARRGVDGRAVFVAPEAELMSLFDEAPPALRDVVARWREEYAGRFETPKLGGSWFDESLEYRFSLAAGVERGRVALSGRYRGGRLDWYTFNADYDASGRARRFKRHTINGIPTPVSYLGMPTSRFWEHEEGTVYFGDLPAGPADLPRLVIADFACVYGDDWFVMPIKVNSGSLLKIDAMIVRDAFGDQHRIESVAALDYARLGDQRPWRMFELTGDRSPEYKKCPYLLVPECVASTLEGPAVERVAIVRDEQANVAWGIEQAYEGAMGRPVHRRRQWDVPNAQSNPPRPDAEPSASPEPWRYRLSTAVPPHWIPFVPEAEGVQMRLRRARMQGWDEIDPRLAGAQGRILMPDPDGPLYWREEAIPRGGLEVTRHWQLARGTDGSLRVWMARRIRPGKGKRERGSGLEMDVVERPDAV